ncbi:MULTISPECIES: hypothetical protein [unclassified Streptomyces]|uniref:hypothetical protein n=1 Tax=unclassified Streptomyces TaxID=2593676 RepID=UPI0011614209|nr:hypothetical protein [Streptomyces sp. CB02058]
MSWPQSMHMIHATLVASAGPSQVAEAAVVTDLIWISARPGDLLEHVFSDLRDERWEITLFIRTKTSAAAQRAAAAICRRAILEVPALHGWQLIDAAPTDVTNPPSRRTRP